MKKLRFEIDWVDAERINGPELSATWASLRICAGDSVITRVLDARAKTVRDFVYVPLYPLAEWLATNWWFLTQEINNPTKEGDPDFHRRHALSASREGYAFPNLAVFSSGGWTHLTWKPGLSPWTKIEFLDQGEIRIDSSEFRDACADVVDQVIRRLLSLGIEETFLQEEWAAIQAADREESEFCATAAGLGLDPYALDESKRDNVIELAEKLSGAVLEEAIAALDPHSLLESCTVITTAIADAKSNGPLLEGLKSIHQKVCLDKEGTAEFQPWKTGYHLARQLRQALALDGTPLPTMPQLAKSIGEAPELLDRITKPVGLHGAALVDGVITWNEDQNPALRFRQLGEQSRRFHFCRALAEVLASPSTDTLITKANSERQQRNRAFAAEFLAPSSGLRASISGQTVAGDEIDELADEFGVSSRVIEHQIRNHRIARVCL